MADDNVTSLPQSRWRYGQPGYYSLADLPQRIPIEKHNFRPGWEGLDSILRFYPGQLIVVTGLAGSGKSTLLFNIACNMAKSQGVRTFLYAPENEAQLQLRMRAIWHDDQTFDVFASRQCFVRSAIRECNEPPHTVDWVLEQADNAIRKDGVDFIIIDPWNELERVRPRDQLMSDYIGESLMLVKDFCRTYSIFLAMVAHPTKAVTEYGGRAVQLSDIEGSMNWFNKADNGLIVARNTQTGTGQVTSAKVREIGAGALGTFDFYIDSQTGVVYPRSAYDEPFYEPTSQRNPRPRPRGR